MDECITEYGIEPAPSQGWLRVVSALSGRPLCANNPKCLPVTEYRKEPRAGAIAGPSVAIYVERLYRPPRLAWRTVRRTYRSAVTARVEDRIGGATRSVMADAMIKVTLATGHDFFVYHYHR